jgi:predicted transcriptional regulator
MKLSEIMELLECELLTDGAELSIDITDVVASDGMSEILAFARSDELMVTGLANIQSIRTADIANVSAVIYCRGKRPANNVIEFAERKKIPVLATKMVIFDICGLLYAKGLKGVS